MRAILSTVIIAAAALVASATASAETIQIKSMDDFAITKERVPAGCSFTKNFGAKVTAQIICGTIEQFQAGWSISSKLKTVCEAKDEKYVCTVSE